MSGTKTVKLLKKKTHEVISEGQALCFGKDEIYIGDNNRGGDDVVLLSEVLPDPKRASRVSKVLNHELEMAAIDNLRALRKMNPGKCTRAQLDAFRKLSHREREEIKSIVEKKLAPPEQTKSGDQNDPDEGIEVTTIGRGERKTEPDLLTDPE